MEELDLKFKEKTEEEIEQEIEQIEEEVKENIEYITSQLKTLKIDKISCNNSNMSLIIDILKKKLEEISINLSCLDLAVFIKKINKARKVETKNE